MNNCHKFQKSETELNEFGKPDKIEKQIIEAQFNYYESKFKNMWMKIN